MRTAFPERFALSTPRSELPALPVDAVVAEVIAHLRKQPNLVVEAPPGAGKTTRIPPALLQFPGDVVVLEPRRLAARMAARRVAAELGESPGQTVGWQVRFDSVTGPQTRLRFVTEGVLTRRLLTDATLSGVATVVLDEFHERHLDTDLALASLRHLQLTTRPDLRIVVMSATLSAEPLKSYLNCSSVRSDGRLYELVIEYAGYSGDPLEDQVARAADSILQRTARGDTLVFLPGAAEIRRAARACEALARRFDVEIATLHGDLSPEEQDRAVSSGARRKLILSTNVAESSITVEGVTGVIDSGLARIAEDSVSTGLPTLQVRRISKASAAQRAGRAGRTRPGLVIRLYSAEDFARRAEHDRAEIHRRELSPVLLHMRAAGVDGLPWFESPPDEAWASANQLLARLGGDMLQMARLPVHPRLARMLLEASARRVASECCRIAAVLSAGDRTETLDVLDAAHQLSPAAERTSAQLHRIARAPLKDSGTEEDVRIAVLSGWPDRLARRTGGESDVKLAGGGLAKLTGPWRGGPLMVAVDVEDRRPALVRLASTVEPSWLLDLYPDRVDAVDEVIWNAGAERVESRSALLYDGIVIDESRSGTVDLAQGAEKLAEAAWDAGLSRFAGLDELATLRARLAFASEHCDLRVPEDSAWKAALRDVCIGLRSFAELRQACEGGGYQAALLARLGPNAARTLDVVAPERIRVGKRNAPIAYVEGQPPSVSSRLQDFFGMRETPRIAGGKVALTVLLLAPSGRPVQTTSDLAGFWTRLYPQVRRELCRRYPKHSWPEDPLAVAP